MLRKGKMTMNMSVFWLIAMIVLLIVEAAVPGLISIWFALGSLGGLVTALLGGPVWLQIGWFILLSVLSLILTRPLVRKYVNSRVKPTNADMMIGRDCVVTEDIDNLKGSGAVSISGKVWTARMESEEEQARAGEVVKVLRIEGVKLIVSK